MIRGLGEYIDRSPSPIQISYNPVKFGGHRDSGCGDMIGFVYDVTLQDHVIKVFYSFLVKSLSKYITILLNLVATYTVVVEI